MLVSALLSRVGTTGGVCSRRSTVSGVHLLCDRDVKFLGGKALEAMGDSSGCLQRALAKAREVARVQIKECREFISRAEHRLAKLEAESVAETTTLEEGRARLSRLEQQTMVLLQFTHQVVWPSWSNRSPHWCRSAMHSEPLSFQRRGEVQ